MKPWTKPGHRGLYWLSFWAAFVAFLAMFIFALVSWIDLAVLYGFLALWMTHCCESLWRDEAMRRIYGIDALKPPETRPEADR